MASRGNIPPGKETLKVYVDKALKRQLRLTAADKNVSYSALVERALRRELGMVDECKICSENGIVTPATRYALGMHLCDECAREYEVLLQPGERLEDMTKEEVDRRLYS